MLGVGVEVGAGEHMGFEMLWKLIPLKKVKQTQYDL